MPVPIRSEGHPLALMILAMFGNLGVPGLIHTGRGPGPYLSPSNTKYTQPTSFKVFVPIDLTISKTFLGGRTYCRCGECEYSDYPTVASDNMVEAAATKFFSFLASLALEIQTYQTYGALKQLKAGRQQSSIQFCSLVRAWL